MKIRSLSIVLSVALLLGLTYALTNPASPSAPDRSGINKSNSEPVEFNFPLALGNTWSYNREVTIRLGLEINALPQRARMSIIQESSPNRFLVQLDGFNPLRDDRPLFAEMRSTANGTIVSKWGEGQLLKGALLPNRLAVGDMINHLATRTFLGVRVNPRSLNFTVVSVDETVTVPAGTFKNAVQMNFAYSDTLIHASGKVFLVSDVGIVKLEAQFNGPIRGFGLAGTAQAELTGYRVRPSSPDGER